MVQIERDCILFKLNKSVQINEDSIYSTPNKNFEKFDIQKLNDKVLKLTYSWLDPVRIRNKIIARDNVSVTFLYFLNLKTFACFGNSESYISYAISKLESKLKLPTLEKVNLFLFCKTQILNNINSKTARLTSIHIYNKNKLLTECDEGDLKKYSIKTLKIEELVEFLRSEYLESFTYKSDDYNTYFYIDKESVISFPENIKEEVVSNVLMGISKELL